MLLPVTAVDGAVLTAERLRTEVKAVTLREGARLAASFGVSVWREGDTAASMLERADAALRQAKATGRDRVVTEDQL